MPTPAPDRLERTYERAVAELTETVLEAPYPRWYEHINQLPLPERLTYCIWVCDVQVCNGGLHQYFWNGYGQFAYETMAYWAMLGDTARTRILRDALALLEVEEPEPAHLREKVNDRTLLALNEFAEPLTSALDQLSDAYFACPRDVEERLQQFLATNGQARLESGLFKRCAPSINDVSVNPLRSYCRPIFLHLSSR